METRRLLNCGSAWKYECMWPSLNSEVCARACGRRHLFVRIRVLGSGRRGRFPNELQLPELPRYRAGRWKPAAARVFHRGHGGWFLGLVMLPGHLVQLRAILICSRAGHYATRRFIYKSIAHHPLRRR